MKLPASRKRRSASDVRLLKVRPESVTLPPRLHLKGKWLETVAGFRPGGTARISILARGMMVIEQLPPPA